MKQAQLYDGRIVSFAPETPDEVIAEHVKIMSKPHLPKGHVTATTQADNAELIAETLAQLPTAQLHSAVAAKLCEVITEAAKNIAEINAESLSPEDIRPLIDGLKGAVNSLDNLADKVEKGARDIIEALTATRTQSVSRGGDGLIDVVTTRVQVQGA